ncbi:BRO-N domain-containing protein [Beijerinckia mobilis]|uniref:BRO-N domain-containing protein n=1 Tax=Beijerinckia mobilis TaxID=231434 RepID=UPI00147036AC|nr:BRO family protein [Beijerinckia mobilis]
MNEVPQKPKLKEQPIKTQDFYFRDALIRTFLKNSEPWFIASDACAALSHTKPTEATEKLYEIEKGVATYHTPGGPQAGLVISESGLYKLIFTARTEAAKEFQDWVTGTVLPSIRKTGCYDLKDDPTFIREKEGPFKPPLDEQLKNNEENEDHLRFFIGLMPEQRKVLKDIFTMKGIYTVYVSDDKSADPIINRIESAITFRDLDYLQAKSIAMTAMQAQAHLDTLLVVSLKNKDFLRSSYWKALEQTITHGYQLAERFLHELQWVNSFECKLGKEKFTD